MLLKRVEAQPEARTTDGDLRELGIDPARARRFFNQHYGMTFHAYCRGRRMGAALKQIREGVRLDDVALGNGYESHSGFRDAFQRTFGDAPGRGRDSDCLVVSWVESPVGPLVLAATDQAICLLEFSDRRALETQFREIRRRFGAAIVPGRNELIDQLKEQLRLYFAGALREFRVPLDTRGSPFQTRVWKQLQRIPYGKTLSYEGLAEKIGSPRGQRAVGRANGQNRIAIVIPCHRVVNKGGQLGGYGGGLWRKKYLLDLERQTLGIGG
jgi:AraC family transcriptional regulator of adaptative response/methylated-DNA-[protein]-cysteine methyltransferase